MSFGQRNALAAAELDSKGERDRGLERQAEDADPTHLEQAGETGGRLGGAFGNVHPVIRHQVEAVLEEAKQQVGLSGTWGSEQQYGLALAGGTARVKLHVLRPFWSGFRRKGSGVVCLRAAWQPFAMVTQLDIERAAARIAGRIRRTPTVVLDGAEFRLPGRITLKLECLQHAGSFKPRGAFNRMLASSLPERGVIAASGGNHGAAVAYAARCLGVPAEIFVPEPTPAAKCARIAAYGATLVRTGARYAEALEAKPRTTEGNRRAGGARL